MGKLFKTNFIISIILVFLCSCQVKQKNVSINNLSKNKETCYLVISENDSDVNKIIVTNISYSIINQFIRIVKPIPPSGTSTNSCIVQVSVVKDSSTYYTSIISDEFNSFGESNEKGVEGIKLSLLS